MLALDPFSDLRTALDRWFTRYLDGDFTSWLLGVPLKIITILAISVIARWLAVRVVNKLVDQASHGAVPSVLHGTRAGSILEDLTPGLNERRQARASAMGSLLRSIITAFIALVAFLTILPVLGIAVGPLLASAGVAGVALGFGAQTLVKDFISGIFMIFEDQYGVGDVIDMGEASGIVEAVGLRVTRLRDVSGTVWYVRNGEVVRVGNSSQNWSRAVLDITVDYASDLDEVQQILREEAQALYEDSRFAGLVLEEPEVWGVERFDRDGVVIRTVLKTAPAHQWSIGRALRSRVKTRFDDAGIRIPTTTFPLLRGPHFGEEDPS